MTAIKDIHTAVDLKRHIDLQKTKKETFQHISEEYVDPMKGLPLDKLFAISDNGDLHRMTEMVCPFIRGVCKENRCRAFIDGTCVLLSDSSKHPRLMKEDAEDREDLPSSETASHLLVKSSSSSHDDDAVSEIVGALLLLALSVSLFSLVYLDVLSLDFPTDALANCDIMAYQNNNTVRVRHMGGTDIQEFRVISIDDGRLIFKGRNFVIGDFFDFDIDGTTNLSIVDEQDREVLRGTFTYQEAGEAPPPSYDYYVFPGESIQDYIDGVGVGESIFVYSGNYSESLIIRKSHFSLVGEHCHTTIIYGDGRTHTVDIAGSEDIFISGFNINNASSEWDDAGVRLKHCSDIAIQSCNITWNKNFGVWFDNVDNCSCQDCFIAFNDNEGITVYNSHFCTIEGNTLEQNQGSGINCKFTCTNDTVYHNYFIDNSPNAYDDNIFVNWDYNYWSDYNGTGVYHIEINNVDNYPGVIP